MHAVRELRSRSIRVRLAGLFVFALVCAPRPASAQDEAASIASAAAIARAAFDAGRCLPEATDLQQVVVAAQAETRPAVRRALVASLAEPLGPLQLCMALADGPTHGVLTGAPTSTPPPAPHGRFRADIGDVDESGSGDFDQQIAIRMINTRRLAIEACYDRELVATPTLSGRIGIQITIQESGAVSGVHVTDNSTGNATLGACVVAVIQGFHFNPGASGGSVSYTFPFVFEPGEPAAPPLVAGARPYVAMPTAPDMRSGPGQMGPADLLRLLNTQQPQILGCYRTALAARPAETGRVSIRLTVEEGTDAITLVSVVDNTTDDSALSACVVGVIRRIGTVNPGPQFGSATFSFTFLFVTSP